MVLGRPRNWAEFAQSAIDIVRKGGDAVSLDGRRLFQLAVLPAFDDAESWELYAKWDSATANEAARMYLVVWRGWRIHRDYPDVDSPTYAGPDPDDPAFPDYVSSRLPGEPTIDITKYEVPAQEIDGILCCLQGLSLPVIPPVEDEVEDGIVYEVEFGGYSLSNRFRWWGDGPSRWEPLRRMVLELLGRLRAGLASATASNSS
jgi:hypothetical protein